jgi:hypothetical protein
MRVAGARDESGVSGRFAQVSQILRGVDDRLQRGREQRVAELVEDPDGLLFGRV